MKPYSHKITSAAKGSYLSILVLMHGFISLGIFLAC